MKRVVVLALVLLAVIGALAWRRGRRQTLVITTREAIVPADGAVHRLLLIRTSRGRLATNEVFLTGLAASVIRESDTEAAVEARSAVNPGTARLSIEYRGKTTSIAVHYVSDSSDRFGDGTPDFLRLHSAADRAAFRGWFTAMADEAALLPRDRLPQEIEDCAALLRWCYRNALHAHDEAWQATMPLESLPPLSSVSQYVYPVTPLGANFFRVRPGAYSSEDVSNGSFAQFADARTLWQRNTFFVTRDVRAGAPRRPAVLSPVGAELAVSLDDSDRRRA